MANRRVTKKVAAAAEKAAVESKETAKAAAKTVVKAAEKAVEKAAAVKEAAPVKEETAEKTEPKKTAGRKTAVKEEFVLEFGGKQVTQEDIIKKVKDNWTKVQKNKIKDIKSLKVFLQPENGCAYYTVNDEGKADYKVEL